MQPVDVRHVQRFLDARKVHKNITLGCWNLEYSQKVHFSESGFHCQLATAETDLQQNKAQFGMCPTSRGQRTPWFVFTGRILHEQSFYKVFDGYMMSKTLKLWNTATVKGRLALWVMSVPGGSRISCIIYFFLWVQQPDRISAKLCFNRNEGQQPHWISSEAIK